MVPPCLCVAHNDACVAVAGDVRPPLDIGVEVVRSNSFDRLQTLYSMNMAEVKPIRVKAEAHVAAPTRVRVGTRRVFFRRKDEFERMTGESRTAFLERVRKRNPAEAQVLKGLFERHL